MSKKQDLTVGMLAEFDYAGKPRQAIISKVEPQWFRTVTLDGYRTFHYDRVQGDMITMPADSPDAHELRRQLEAKELTVPS